MQSRSNPSALGLGNLCSGGEEWPSTLPSKDSPLRVGRGEFSPSTSEVGGHLRGGGHRGEGLIKEASAWEAREKMLTQTSEFQKRAKSVEMGHLF